LAIARRLCDIQGWRLGVDSSETLPGRGTAFHIEFGDSVPPQSGGTGIVHQV
jgi:hypothetical protein